MTFFLIAGGCLLLLLLSVMITDNHRFVVRKYSVSSSKTEDTFTFVFLTDLHSKRYGRNNEKLLQAIDRIHPDAVLIGGDMIIAAQAMKDDEKSSEHGREEHGPTKKNENCLKDANIHENEQKCPDDWMESALSLINSLTAKYPVYYVNGNHELKLHWHREFCGDAYERLMEALEEAGAIWLHNRTLAWNCDAKDEAQASGTVQKKSINTRQNEATDEHEPGEKIRECEGGNEKKHRIMFYGLELDYPFYKKFHKETLTVEEIERQIGKPDPAFFTVLITHNPRYFESYAAWGADLVLCGHVHGGIARIPFAGGAISPYITLFPKYSGGRYVLPKKDGTESVMILSCGLGMHTLPVRVFNPAELSVIELNRQ